MELGNGCIILDLGCYFPYPKNTLTFRFDLGNRELEPYILNLDNLDNPIFSFYNYSEIND